MDIVIRAAFMFLLLFVLTRAVGKRELSSMQPFDLILMVVLGDLIQQGVTQNDQSVTGAALAVCTMALLTVAISYLAWRFRFLRPVLDGEPLVLVESGRPIEQNLKRERIAIEEVLAEARMQGIAALKDIRFAVLETDGRISFIQSS